MAGSNDAWRSRDEYHQPVSHPKAYGTVEVIRDISFSVAKGEVVCVIGPSGSGKSTILRCINGLERYQSGEIKVHGTKVDPADRTAIRAVRTRVSMVFQRFNLFPHRTAIENVAEGPIYVKGEPREQALARARELLTRVGLGAKADAYPAQLSVANSSGSRSPGPSA